MAAEVGAVERALAHRGLEHRIQVAEVPGDVSRLATAALDEGYRYLAAVGDDGTVQDVVNGMFRDGRTIVDSPVLAVMAAGSGCDLVRSFGLPGDVDGASSHLIGENTYELDVMKITARGRNGSRPRSATRTTSQRSGCTHRLRRGPPASPAGWATAGASLDSGRRTRAPAEPCSMSSSTGGRSNIEPGA